MTDRWPSARLSAIGRRCFALPPVLFLLAVQALAQQPQQARPSTPAINAAPSALAVLARHLSDAEIYQRLEFAQIALDAMIDAYRWELDAARAERPKTPARRQKLARWQRATQALLGELSLARWRLSEARDITVTVDSASQVIVLIDRKPLIVSASRPALEQLIERSVVEQFCAFNDCSFLRRERGTPAQRAPAVAGNWHLGAPERPVYDTGRDLHCVFSSLTERRRKASVCTQLLDQLLELQRALGQAQRRGYPIDWQVMAGSRPENAAEPVLQINDSGAFVRVPPALLARLDANDWDAAVRWLREGDDGGKSVLVVRRADKLLPFADRTQ
jgi:hypothetical protein